MKDEGSSTGTGLGHFKKWQVVIKKAKEAHGREMMLQTHRLFGRFRSTAVSFLARWGKGGLSYYGAFFLMHSWD
jgi:hypothetical protein